ncbi:MAG: hypothetical protein LBV00_11495 [Propionibacteriaceae bacterium]|jgi:hypothetical protein|nr:hypothetical protein [Propionibacteriaceae bacterium]
MKKTFLWMTAFILGVSGSLMTSGCSAQPQAESSPTNSVLASSLRALFRDYLDNPNLSDFEREVITRAIETGGITQEDYEEGFRRYISCMVDAGYVETYEKRPDGIYQLTPPQKVNTGEQSGVEAYMEQGTNCADGTVMRIEALYNDQLNNPGLLADSRELAVECLIRSGKATVDYTPEQFEKDFAAGFTNTAIDPTDPQVKQCMASAGFAYAGKEG